MSTALLAFLGKLFERAPEYTLRRLPSHDEMASRDTTTTTTAAVVRSTRENGSGGNGKQLDPHERHHSC